jgi:hypothetical protein
MDKNIFLSLEVFSSELRVWTAAARRGAPGRGQPGWGFDLPLR